MASKARHAMRHKETAERKTREREELARWRGFDSAKDMARVSETRTNEPTTKRKPYRVKLKNDARWTDNSQPDKPVKGKASAPSGAFVLFGARTKEGLLQLKQRGPNDKRKSHECEHKRSLQFAGIGMHESTNDTRVTRSTAAADGAAGSVPAFVTSPGSNGRSNGRQTASVIVRKPK